MLEYLKPKEKNPKPPKIVETRLPTKRSMKRALPQIIRQAIITIAYNSESDFSEIRHNPTKIARLFKLQRNTVRGVI